MIARDVIDVQTHFLPNVLVDILARREELPRLVERDGMRFVEYGPGAAYPLVPSMTDAARKLTEMDAGGVALSALSVNIPGLDWLAPSEAGPVARAVNDELAAMVAAHADRFSAFAALPLQVPDVAVAELERTTALGLHGTMIYSNVAGRHLDEPAFRSVFDAAAQLNSPVLLHPTYPLSGASIDAYALVPVLGFLFDTATATMRLIFDGLYERHPEFALILAHVGSVLPFIVGRLDYESGRIPGGRGALTVAPSEHLRRLNVDTVSAWPPALRLAIDFLGASHVLFASDHPFWDPARTHEALDELELTPQERAAINGGNARRVLGIGPRG
jgi:predicted TIM-barrel fold metal-dependent hydrolase